MLLPVLVLGFVSVICAQRSFQYDLAESATDFDSRTLQGAPIARVDLDPFALFPFAIPLFLSHFLLSLWSLLQHFRFKITNPRCTPPHRRLCCRKKACR